MKTNSTSTFYPGIKKMIISGLLSFLMVISVSAQEKEADKSKSIRINSIAATTNLSGVGFGLRFSPLLGIGINKRTTILAGPVLKLDKPHYSGYLVKGRFTLLNANDSYSGSTFLYLFGSFEKMKNQYFSDKWNDIEILTSRHSRIEDFNFKNVKFDGYEFAGGFGLGNHVSKRISWNMDLGVSIYKTDRLNYNSMKLYHQPKGFTLHLSCTVRYDLHRN